jgi:trigger factor
MNVEITELGPLKRALKIEIPAEDVNRHFSEVYKELNRQVRIPGFRPGKAPQSLLEKRYSKTVEDDVVRRLIPEFYQRAIRQAQIIPVLVDVPPLDRLKIKKDEPLAFTATVEIKPKIELRDYKSPNPISLKPDTRTVSDEQIDKALDMLRDQQAALHPAPAGAEAVEGDFALLDLEGFVDQTPIEGAKKDGHLYQLGSKEVILGVEIDTHLFGRKEGDLVEVPQAYPVAHPDSRLAGKTAIFRVAIKSLKRKQLPALDDEFAKDCGPFSTLSELRDKMREQMELALKKDVEATYKDTILKRLSETHHFELPDSLIERELSSLVRQLLDAQFRQKGRAAQLEDPAKRQEETDRLREENREEAIRRVKLGLILETIAEREGLKVEQEDLVTEIQHIAQELKIPMDDVRRMVEAGGSESVEELRGRILAQKSLDFVFRNSVIQG